MSESFNQSSKSSSSLPPPTFVNCDVDKSKQIQMPMMIAPGNHERAWNDPPMLAAAGAAKPSGVTKLNKRVAFPLSSQTSPSPMSSISPPPMAGMVGQPPQNLPPMAGMVGQPRQNLPAAPYVQQRSFTLQPNQFVPSTNVSFTFTPYDNTAFGNILSQESPNANVTSTQGGQDPKEQIMNSLRKSVDDSTLEASQKDEIHKRLDLLSANWHTVEDNLKGQLGQLTGYIDSKDYKEADRIQMLIGQDYMSQHSSWILGLRNVVGVLLTMQQQQQGQPVQS